MNLKCPKCGCLRKSVDGTKEEECPECGVVYAKYEAYLEKLKALNDKKPTPSLKNASKKPRITTPILVVLLIIVVFSLSKIFKVSPEDPSASQDQETSMPSDPRSEKEDASEGGQLFSNSKALKNILLQIQTQAAPYDIEVSLKDLKSSYNKGRHMISIPNLTIGIAKKVGLPLPETMAMPDDEFEQKKRYKCMYGSKGWQYLDDLPRSDHAISECWAQLENYGSGVITGNEITFTSGFSKVWVSRKWDPEQTRWVQFSKKEKSIARRYLIEEKARKAIDKINTHDHARDDEQSQELLALHVDQLAALNNELKAFGKDKLQHLEAARPLRNFNKEDRLILKVLSKIRSTQSKIKHAIILGYSGRIKEIGLREFLDREGVVA